MLSFKEFLVERAAPEDIAHRFVRRHSTTPHNDKWSPAKKHEYIKLKQAPEHEVEHAMDKWGETPHVRPKHGVKFKIKDLHATQPIVHHIADKFKKKVAETNPKHISVVTHKGKHYIDDGHHAVMAARLRGDKEITATHHNLDEH